MLICTIFSCYCDHIQTLNLPIQMHFIIYFPVDKEVVLIERDFLLLGTEMENMTGEDWGKMANDRRCSVRAFYDGDIYDAVIIQAVPELDEGIDDQLKVMRTLVKKKNYREEKLLSMIQSRVRRGRARFPPMEVSRQHNSGIFSFVYILIFTYMCLYMMHCVLLISE